MSIFNSNTRYTFSKKQLLFLTVSLAICSSIRPVDSTLNQTKHSSSPFGRRTLIVVDKSTNVDKFRQTYSFLIDIIQKLDYKVVVRGADDSTLKISKYGEYIYDNVLLFCPEVNSLKANIYVKDLVEYINSDNNLVLILNNSPGHFAKQIASEIGVQIKSGGTEKEFNNIKFKPLLYATDQADTYTSKVFGYKGTQYKIIKSELTHEILVNNAVDDTRPNTASKFISNILVSVLQARNNARVLVSGSSEFFSDIVMSDSKLANKQLVSNLIEWVFKEKSILRAVDVQHRKLNLDPKPSTDVSRVTNFEGYTINDDIEYTIKIEIYNKGQWTPYTGDDVQLEFIRIDPFVRKTMTREDNKHVARFKVPDVYGVYKFQVDYGHDGLSHLVNSTIVSVRPLRHNEYERFIYSAYPYYLSAFLMMVYLYIFCFVYLYQKKESTKKKE